MVTQDILRHRETFELRVMLIDPLAAKHDAPKTLNENQISRLNIVFLCFSFDFPDVFAFNLVTAPGPRQQSEF